MRSLWIATSLCLVLFACGKPGPASSAAEGQAPPTEAETDDAEASEGAGTRKEQCERLGAVIEQIETGTSIVNANDATKMKALAAQRRAAAEEAGGVALDDDALIALRDRYVGLCNAMAKALDGVASPDRDARVAAVADHSKLDGDVGALVDELNGTCSGG